MVVAQDFGALENGGMFMWILSQSGCSANLKLTKKTVPSCCYKVGAQDVDALTRDHALIYNIYVPEENKPTEEVIF